MADGPSSTIVYNGDSSGAVAALHAIDAEAKRVASSVNGTAASLNKIGDGADAGAAKAVAATKRFESQLKRLNLEVESGGKNTAAYIEGRAKLAGADTAALAPLLARYDELKAKQALANAEFTKSGKVMTDYGMGVKATSAALRQVPAQFTDIIVSLQGGQAPLTVLLQQGGQLKDVFGGVGNAFKALSSYVIGLINPFTLAIAAVGTLVYAYTKGAAESEAYNKALILTGNYADATAARLSVMAQSVSQASGGTVGAAAEALAALAGSGTIAASQFDKLAAAAILMQKSTGAAVSETVKQFAELGKEPLSASLKLNDATNYLTSSVYEQIKSLTEQGRILEAGVIAQNAYADVMKNRAPSIVENLGWIEQAWNGVANATKNAIDWAKGVGRTGDAVEILRKQIAVREGFIRDSRNGSIPADDATLNGLKQQLSYLQETERMTRRSSESQAASAAGVKAQVEFDKEHDKYLSRQVKMEREIAAAREKYTNLRPEDQDPAKYAQIINGIQEKFKEPAAKKGPSNLNQDNIAKAQVALDIARIKAESDALTGAYANGQKVMEALRSAGLVSDGEYFAAKRAALQANNAIEEASLQANITRLEQEKLIGRDKIAIETKLVEARAKLAGAQAAGKTGNVLLDMQESAAGAATDKFFADQIAASDKRGIDMVESIRVSQLSAFDVENEGFAKRIAALTLFNAMRAEGEASVNGLIEEESARHQRTLSDMQANYDLQSLQMVGNTADQFLSIMEKSGKDQTALSKALFLATKAIAVAEIIMNTERAAAASLATTGFLGIPLSTYIRATGYASAGMVAGMAIAEVAGGRADGGPVDAGKLYEVNEKGPELLSSGGREFLMMGSQGGNITPNNKLGGSGAITIVNNTSAKIGKVTEQTLSNGERAIIIEEAVAATAAQMGDPNSRVSRSMSRNFSTQRSR